MENNIIIDGKLGKTYQVSSTQRGGIWKRGFSSLFALHPSLFILHPSFYTLHPTWGDDIEREPLIQLLTFN